MSRRDRTTPTRHWTGREDRVLLQFWPDTEALARWLPDRNENACRHRIIRLRQRGLETPDP